MPDILSPEGFARVKELFLACVDRPIAEQQRHLDEASSGDDELKQQVWRMLRSQPSSIAAVTDVVDPAACLITAGPGAAIGESIGPYKLMEQLGEGGMGIVYIAEQKTPVRRQVALKVIKPGMDTRQVVARFEAERQALSMMDHPHIARIFDGEPTSEGRPYFVMELVRGVPITDFCDAERLTIRQRLELFIQVCQAVQHAHQKGIIHRDLKPSNILVTRHDETPVPKVIDFGVAKAVNQSLTDKTIYTQFAQFIGTPLYMSPEQAQLSGLDIDTRSDVYSLGVLLYELLTGTTPFDAEILKQKGLDEMRRIIREDEPLQPSQRISTLNAQACSTISERRSIDTRRLRQLVRGELDWIVMRAMEKDRTRRYDSPSDFASDIEHYLRDETVRACPPSTIYRLGKFTRHHKLGLSIAGLTLTCLLVAGSGLGWMLSNYFNRVDKVANTIRQATDEATLRLRIGDPHDLQLKGAMLKAEIQMSTGLVDQESQRRFKQLGADLIMLTTLERISRESSPSPYRSQEELLSPSDIRENTTIEAQYSDAFREYGLYVDKHNISESAARIRASAISERLLAAVDSWGFTRRKLGPKDDGWRRLVSVATMSDTDPTRNAIRQSLLRDIGKEELEHLVNSTPLEALPSSTLFYLHQALRDRKSMELAIWLLRIGNQRFPGNFAINAELGHLLTIHAHQHKQAISFARAALALRPESSHALALLALTLEADGQLGESVVYASKALRIDSKDRWAGMTLANSLARLGRFDEAIATLNPMNMEARSHVAILMARNGKPDQAYPILLESLKLNPKDPILLGNFGALLCDLGRETEGIDSLRAAVDLHPDEPELRMHLGHALTEYGAAAEAIQHLRRAIELSPQRPMAHVKLAFALGENGQADEAIEQFGLAAQLNPEMTPSMESVIAWLQVERSNPSVAQVSDAIARAKRTVLNDPSDADYWGTLGIVLYRGGNWEAALNALQKSLELQGEGGGENQLFIAMCYARLDQQDDANKWYRRAVEHIEIQSPGLKGRQFRAMARWRAEADQLLHLTEQE